MNAAEIFVVVSFGCVLLACAFAIMCYGSSLLPVNKAKD